MSVTAAASFYFAINLSVATGFFFSLIVARLRLRSKDQLWLNYCLVALSVGAVFVGGAVPSAEVFTPPVKVWANENFGDVSHLSARIATNSSARLELLSTEAPPFWQIVLPLVAGLVLALFLATVSKLVFDILRLYRFFSQSLQIRRIGCVHLFASDEFPVPFAFWIPGRACVVIPIRLLANRLQTTMAVAHELQHHRQGDTQWIFFLSVLRSVCFLNPFAHLWVRGISELQEYACDETLVDQEKVNSQAYARCLVETAQHSLSFARQPAGATGLSFAGRRQHLRWRIEKMFSEKNNVRVLGRPLKFMSLAVLTCLMACAGWASNSVVGDRRISMAQAREMAKSSNSDFPVTVNAEVVRQLNRMVGTPEGRKWINESLGRMKNLVPQMKSKFESYSAPEELYAIPLIESGFKNLAQGPRKGTGAGIWQFIASTARIFKLRVDDQVDDRLDVEKQTDAALRLLLSDRLRFDDWALAILSYNAGEQNVQKAIDKTGSRDPWVLVRAGLKTDRNYLAKVNAAVLILRNPDSI